MPAGLDGMSPSRSAIELAAEPEPCDTGPPPKRSMTSLDWLDVWGLESPPPPPPPPVSISNTEAGLSCGGAAVEGAGAGAPRIGAGAASSSSSSSSGGMCSSSCARNRGSTLNHTSSEFDRQNDNYTAQLLSQQAVIFAGSLLQFQRERRARTLHPHKHIISDSLHILQPVL